MRTAEDIFVEIAAQEIPCPCGSFCTTKPKPVYRTRVIGTGQDGPYYFPTHETFDHYVQCVATHTHSLVKERIREIRERAEKNTHLPMDTWRLFDDGMNANVYIRAVKKFNLHFATTEGELDRLIVKHLFAICDVALEDIRDGRVST